MMLSLLEPTEKGSVANFALQIRKLKLRAVKRAVQGHRTSWTQNWEAS